MLEHRLDAAVAVENNHQRATKKMERASIQVTQRHSYLSVVAASAHSTSLLNLRESLQAVGTIRHDYRGSAHFKELLGSCR